MSWSRRSSFLLGLLILALRISALPAQAAPPPGQLIVLPTDRAAGESFGAALALDGDTLIVGAPFADVDGKNKQGQVVIFTRAGETWTEVKRITAADGAASDGFGAAVALHGDTLVVGAIYADPNGETNQGAAYVFYRHQGGPNAWGQIRKITGSQDNRLDNFGSSLAVHGDDLFVAAPNQGPNVTGMVYHFRRHEGGTDAWGEVQNYRDPDRRDGDNFGSSLAFDGSTLVIGAQRADLPVDLTDDIDDRPDNNVGAVFIYTSTVPGAWEPAVKLYSSDGRPDIFAGNHRFGAAVALLDNLLVVGAPNIRGANGEVAMGKVYLFQGSGAQWSEIAKFTGSAAGATSSFGRSVTAVAGGVIVGAETTVNDAISVDTLYLFTPAATLTAGRPAVAVAWQETAKFLADDDVFIQSGWGRTLASDGERLVVGAPTMENGRGGVYLYPVDQLGLKPPAAQSATTYLPALAYNQSTPVVSGRLAPGGKLVLDDGAGIAALAGALTTTVDVALTRVPLPAVATDPQVTLLGDAYRFAAPGDAIAPTGQPFLIALPVPAGADSTHLALAALIEPQTVLDAAWSAPAWVFFEGQYDPAKQRFVTTWPSLTAQGVTLAVAQHPDFAAAAEIRTAAGPPFRVECIGFQGDPTCTATTEAQVAALLSDIYDRMTAASGFGFNPPRLRNLAGNLNFDANSLASLGYTAYIELKPSATCTDAKAGYFSPDTARLVLCLTKGTEIGDFEVAVLIHEFFHSIQFGNDPAYADWRSGADADWVIEGMAAAAEESYFLDTDVVRSNDFDVMDMDVALDFETTVVTATLADHPYRAQDFWVYTGHSLDTNLGYFKHILRYGADLAAVDTGLLQHLGRSFREQFWDFTSNQLFEKSDPLGGALGATCVLEEAVLDKGIQHKWQLVQTAQIQQFPSGVNPATVPPLTTMVVQILFPGDRMSEQVMFSYPECTGIDDPAQARQCFEIGQERLAAQFYYEGSPGCSDDIQGRLVDADERGRTFFDIQDDRRYFVIVTNLTETDQRFRLSIEISGGGP